MENAFHNYYEKSYTQNVIHNAPLTSQIRLDEMLLLKCGSRFLVEKSFSDGNKNHTK